MNKSKKHGYMRIIAALLSVIMLFGVMPLNAFAAETAGDWVIDGNQAAFGDTGFVFHAPAPITSSPYGDKVGVTSGTNGKASNGVVVTDGTSYADFTPKSDGTLTVYVGKAANTKTVTISRTGSDGTGTAVDTFIPDCTDESNKTNYDTGLKVTHDTQWAVAELEVESGYTYYITVTGSKMKCYGAEFVPYTKVSGAIKDKFNLGSYKIKFTDKESGIAKQAEVSGTNYSIYLKPGCSYSAALTDVKGYAFTSATRNVDVKAGADQTADLEVEETVTYTVSGALKGFAGDVPSDLKLTFIPEDTSNYDPVKVTIDSAKKSYSAELTASQKYTLTVEGACDYELTKDVIVNNEDGKAVTQDIEFAALPLHKVSGGFLGLTQIRGEYTKLGDVQPSAITFENVEDGYKYSGTTGKGTYSASLRDGAYLASITSDGYSTSTHVVVSGGDTTRDLLLKDESKKEVAYKDTLEVGADKEYKTVQSAVDAAAAMTRTDGQRVTIKVAPGTYREQVVISVPDITIAGSSKDDTKITWYYGIGYKYYSCVDSCYSPYADYDKFDKGNVVSYWAAAVIPQKTATGFRAENITFENSFNKYMTDEEMADGAEPNGIEAIAVARKETTDVEAKTSTERAAALVNYADKTEFENCAFIGSQDTLYTTNTSAHKAYYKNCYIEGQTDFIFGTGDVIFDGCEINFCGYSDTAAAGYLTANSSSVKDPAKLGYVFRGCYVSYNKDRKTTPGTYGRMWGDKATVTFINTQLEDPDMISADGWTTMGSNNPASMTTLTEYNTTYNGEKINTSGRVNKASVKDSLDLSAYEPEKALGWKPYYYDTDTAAVPEIAGNPSMTTTSDMNALSIGNRLYPTYTLNDECKDEDASMISWYSVETDYDKTSLDTILKKSTLLKTVSAVSDGSKEFQIPTECAGKYIMFVVTPITVSGKTGTPKYCIEDQRPIGDVWDDPSNPGSIAPGSGINIYLAGDSTVKDYSAKGMYNSGKARPEGSWGEFLQEFFNDEAVTVNNYANGGRSLRSFLNEGSLDKIAATIKKGDYLFIQFGHNDCGNEAEYYADRFVPLFYPESAKVEENFPTVLPEESLKKPTPEALAAQKYGDKCYTWDCGATYKGYLQYYINVALEKGATPVIVTPVSRLYYTDGKIRTHHDAVGTNYAPTAPFGTSNDAYVRACRELYEENKAKGNNVLLLDNFAITKELYEDAYAACGSEKNGKDIMNSGESTHSNKTGGMIQAGLMAKWIQDADISLSKYVKQPENVYGENPDGEYIFTVKNSVFTAKNSSYEVNDYWTKLGQEIFDSLSGGEVKPPVTSGASGDADNSGIITSNDAALVFKYAMEGNNSADVLAKCDVNGDGKLNAYDASQVLSKAINENYEYAA